jgi:hypothetical protein
MLAEVKAEEVIRELKKLGFSCIGKAVDWRNELVTVTDEGEKGGATKTVLVPRVTRSSRQATPNSQACRLQVRRNFEAGPPAPAAAPPGAATPTARHRSSALLDELLLPLLSAHGLVRDGINDVAVTAGACRTFRGTYPGPQGPPACCAS